MLETSSLKLLHTKFRPRLNAKLFLPVLKSGAKSLSSFGRKVIAVQIVIRQILLDSLSWGFIRLA